jgi:hypothetical protein
MDNQAGECRRTFGEETILPSLGVLAQKPAITKVIVAFNKLNAVPTPQTKLVGTASQELIWSIMLVYVHVAALYRHLSGHIRTTTRVSPARQCSVWERCIVATVEGWWDRVLGVQGREVVGGWARLKWRQSPKHKTIVVHLILYC